MSIAHRFVAEFEADAVEQEQVMVGRRDGQLLADARLLVSHQFLESALVKFVFHPFVKLGRPCERLASSARSLGTLRNVLCTMLPQPIRSANGILIGQPTELTSGKSKNPLNSGWLCKCSRSLDYKVR
jgi:hypothetical protein